MRKVAIITGGAKRVGKTIATKLASHGYDLVLHYHQSVHEAQQLAHELQQQYANKTVLVQANLAQEEGAAILMDKALQHFSRFDLLINNASSFLHDDMYHSPVDVWQENMMVNLRSPFVLAQLFAQSQNQGLIINMLDSKLENLSPYYASYTAAKAGLYALTKMLAQTYAPNIRVNGIGPGLALFPDDFDKEKLHKLVQSVPTKRTIDLEDIADTVIYLSQTSSITGQMIMLDDGLHLGWKHRSS